MPKGFLFIYLFFGFGFLEFMPKFMTITSQKKLIIGILFSDSIFFSNVSRRYWVALKMYIPFVFIAIHVK